MNDTIWGQAQEWWEARQLRERGILLLAVLLVLGYFWNDFALAYQVDSNAQNQRMVTKATADNVILSSEHAELQLVAAEDPNLELRQRIERLQMQNEALDRDLELLSGKLVEPGQMASVLSSVLSKQSRLELVNIENRPPETLFFRAASSEESDPREKLEIYKHGIQLKLRGRFLDNLEYLDEVESLGYHFYWQRAYYESNEYPNGLLTLEIFTLSTKEQWIDV